MNWTFIQKNGSWWLKIRTIQEYEKYRRETDTKRYGDILKNIIKAADGKIDTDPVTTAVLFENEKSRRGKSAFELVADFSCKVTEWQVKYLIKGYYLLFNRAGGCHFDKDETYRWMHRNDLVFPEFTLNDIRIEKFPDGRHCYAYIGSVQVRDGDVLKWDSYEEAHNIAEKYITG